MLSGIHLFYFTKLYSYNRCFFKNQTIIIIIFPDFIKNKKIEKINYKRAYF